MHLLHVHTRDHVESCVYDIAIMQRTEVVGRGVKEEKNDQNWFNDNCLPEKYKFHAFFS